MFIKPRSCYLPPNRLLPARLIVTAFRAAASGQSSLSSHSLRAPVSLRSLSTWFSKSTWCPVTPRLPRWLHHVPSSPPAFLSEYRKSLSPLLSPHDRSFETQSPKGSFGNVRRIGHCLAQDPSEVPRFAPSENRSHVCGPPPLRDPVLTPSDPVSSPSPSLLDVLGEHPPSPAPGRAWLSRGPLSSSRAALKSPSPRGPLYRTSCNCCCHCPNLRSLFLPPPQRLAVMIRVCLPLPPPPPTAWLHAGGLCSPRHEDSTSQTCLLDPRSRFSRGHRTAPPPSTSGRQRKMVKTKR